MGILVISFALFGGTTFLVADHYTAKPEFCGSCHVMDPYFASWQVDVHGKAGGIADCVDCHYAPGERSTFDAKFRGLSQAASYFSGRFGASRPRAQIDNRSCLTSECHGGLEFMDQAIWLGGASPNHGSPPAEGGADQHPPTVTFVHAKHLQPDPAVEEGRRAQQREILTRLEERLDNDAVAMIQKLGQETGDALDRERKTTAYLRDASADLVADAVEYGRLEHALVRSKQLSNLGCSSCHTFDDTGKHHISVARTTCFTCHFTNQAFNSGTGECLLCHSPPSGNVAVHGGTEGNAMMNHDMFVARGVNCASCHSDLIQGTDEVNRRDCTHCHDQDHYMKDFEHRTTAIVQQYHEAHTAEQHARCTDCHRVIDHQLVRTPAPDQATFLQPVKDDCQHCHPDHHREQVELLMGVGGSGIARPLPNPMFGSRVSCQACHTESGNDFKGDPLIQATKKNCVACHDETYDALYDEWIAQLSTRLAEVEALEKSTLELVAEVPELDAVEGAKIKELLARAQRNLALVRTAHGVHNRGYALELMERAAGDLREVASLTKSSTVPDPSDR
jgi:nitrate/TMAO reductase-like tetraheme cytochrome c subunit